MMLELVILMFVDCYRPLRQGNVFTPVCHSVHVGGGGVHGRGACMTGAMHGSGVCMAGGMCGRYYEIWSISGRYASYWNAFLFKLTVHEK